MVVVMVVLVVVRCCCGCCGGGSHGNGDGGCISCGRDCPEIFFLKTNFVLNHFLQSFELELELFSTSFLVNSLSAKIKIKNKAGLVAQSVMSAIVLIR